MRKMLRSEDRGQTGASETYHQWPAKAPPPTLSAAGLSFFWALVACEPVEFAREPTPEITVPWALFDYVKPRIHEANAQFGRSIALHPRALVIGAPQSGDCGGPSPDLSCPTVGALTVLPPRPTPASDYRILPAPNATTRDGFALRLAVSADWLLVGMPSAAVEDPAIQETVDRAGAVQLYRFDATQWMPAGRLVSPQPRAGQKFGAMVAVQPPWAAVHELQAICVDDEDCAGAVHLFRETQDGWRWQKSFEAVNDSPEAQLPQGPNARGMAFGDGFLAVVSPKTFRKDDGLPCLGVGSVVIYEQDGETWREQSRLHPADLADRMPCAGFGASIDVAENRVYVGASGEGAVYIYESTNTGWEQFGPPLTVEGQGSEFGASVSAMGNEVLVGAPHDRNCTSFTDPQPYPIAFSDACATKGLGPGAAYLFNLDVPERPRWVFTPLQTGSNVHYGVDVVMTADSIVVGAPFDQMVGTGVGQLGPMGGASTGAVYVYERRAP